MTRFLSRTLTLTLARSSPIHASPFLIPRRHRSTKAQLIEIDLSSSADGSAPGDAENPTLKRLEDVVHNLIARRSAPDWIDFVPGTSYWVPPRPKSSSRFVEIVGRITNPLTEEEELCLHSVNGAPCSSFFIDGVVPHNPAATGLGVVEFHVQPCTEEAPEEPIET